jgi:predicted FMN-binding regulatory protein PaiB
MQDLNQLKEQALKIMGDPALALKQGKEMMVKIKGVPKEIEDSIQNDSIIDLAVLGGLIAVCLDRTDIVGATIISQNLSIAFMLGVAAGLKANDIPDAFKDAFKKGD